MTLRLTGSCRIVQGDADGAEIVLHEHPELKASPYVWLTDVVELLPMPDGGAGEAALTADYNAEMVEHIARYPCRQASS